MTTKKNILNAIDRYFSEWRLDSKVLFQNLFIRLDNLEKKVEEFARSSTFSMDKFKNQSDELLANIKASVKPIIPAPADKAKLNKAIEMCENAIADLMAKPLPKPNDKRTKWTAKDDTILRKMKAKGHSFDEIAEVLGRTHKSVETRWHKHVKPTKAE